jgi:hypothetical protein
MSSNKTWIVVSTLAAGANDNPEAPAIPADETWMIRDFKAADIDFGDNKSSVYVLRFGTDIMEFISLTGNTMVIPVNEELTGDGSKKLNVMRYNNSGHPKQMPFKVTAYKRQ